MTGKKMMLKPFGILLPAVFCCMVIFNSCNHAQKANTPAADTIGIRKTLDTLYQSFGFDAGMQPQWDVMRSLALPGATFISAPKPGAKRAGMGIDQFINDYKSYIQTSPIRQTGYHEHIVQTLINRVNTVATATVIFKATVPGDTRSRKPGMDNIQLLLDKGSWKITAFTTQSESDAVGPTK